MKAERSTATHRRAEAIAAGMAAFADHGPTTSAIERVAAEIGVSQPYVFRLFGSKQTFFLACLDELETRVRDVFRRAAATSTEDPTRATGAMRAMGEGFRDLVADGVITGLWLQACALARGNDEVAARCRALISGVLHESARLTGAGPADLAGFLADGALVMLLQALGVDLTGGSRTAVASLLAEEANA